MDVLNDVNVSMTITVSVIWTLSAHLSKLSVMQNVDVRTTATV